MTGDSVDYMRTLPRFTVEPTEDQKTCRDLISWEFPSTTFRQGDGMPLKAIVRYPGGDSIFITNQYVSLLTNFPACAGSTLENVMLQGAASYNGGVNYPCSS